MVLTSFWVRLFLAKSRSRSFSAVCSPAMGALLVDRRSIMHATPMITGASHLLAPMKEGVKVPFWLASYDDLIFRLPISV